MKLHFYIGLILIAFSVFDFMYPIQPIALWYIPIIWYGYIFVVDSIVFRLKRSSLIVNYPKEFVFMFLISVPFWLAFEFYNLFTKNWVYFGFTWYIHLVDFTIIIPAVIEGFMLLNSLHLFSRFKAVFPVKRWELYLVFLLGIFSAVAPILFPKYGFPFMWLVFFFLLEPIDFSFLKSGLLYQMSRGRMDLFYSAILAGPLTGFFWELWNYLAYPKWAYNIPFMNTLPKLFAMPLPGYLGYIPFSLSVLAFYVFFHRFVFKYKNPIFR